MSKISSHILRIGLAVTFIWIGVLILKNPEAWGGYLNPWAIKLLNQVGVTLSVALIQTAILDILIGILLILNALTWVAATVSAVHISIVLIVSGITDITVRDIGLLAGAIAVAIDSLPESWFN
ncbi:MAG: DoxX family membrane protein [Candidatus Vogelbacteria bacterium]|nr:DoxX family membrane protein [Candidatus Vogelbacteria bacterium]